MNEAEIREGLADHEATLEYLQALHTPAFCSYEIQNIPHKIEEEPEWTKRQWYIIQQLREDNKNLRKQWYEHLEEDREWRTSKKKGTSYLYSNIKEETTE